MLKNGKVEERERKDAGDRDLRTYIARERYRKKEPYTIDKPSLPAEISATILKK